MQAMDRAGFRGRYVVLGGRLSPLDGIGPESLRMGLLEAQVLGGGVREVVLATNPSLEGEATATYIQQVLAGHGVRVSRLARGLPVGGDLEYVDGVTLTHALQARQEVVMKRSRGAPRGCRRGGWAGWLAGRRRRLERHRNDFSPPAAPPLGGAGLAGGRRPGRDAPLLRDYLAWESEPVLRQSRPPPAGAARGALA